ncbi:MAG: hypothetical protein HY902_11040 [Deltaproteobacteria bacterium]|nr:hypothetical protein [Deltaproteobacteria bacterium]
MLGFHGMVRWAVVVAGVVALVLAAAGMLGKRPFGKANRVANLIFMISADVQFLLGLLTYAGSELVAQALGDFGAAMKVPNLRFFALEHALLATLGLAALHIAYARAKRASDDAARHRTSLIGFAVAMLLFAMAIPWPWRAVIGRPL